MELPSTRTLRYWARKGGGSRMKDGTLGFKGRRMGPSNDNSKAKTRHYTRLLVANARARGFVNGVSIRGGTQ